MVLLSKAEDRLDPSGLRAYFLKHFAHLSGICVPLVIYPYADLPRVVERVSQWEGLEQVFGGRGWTHLDDHTAHFNGQEARIHAQVWAWTVERGVFLARHGLGPKTWRPFMERAKERCWAAQVVQLDKAGAWVVLAETVELGCHGEQSDTGEDEAEAGLAAARCQAARGS